MPEDAPPSAEDSQPPAKKPKRFPRLSRGAIAFCLMLGLLAGIGTFTFGYGKGASYLSNDPQGCANCHVMQEYYDTWQHSSHHHVAVCNDCHLPHDFIGKYVTKADNGFFHSLAFTFGNYHDPIQIKPRNREITEHACLDCHKDFIHPLLPPETEGLNKQDLEMLSCVHCHADVGHAFRPMSSGSRRESP
ncbi:cytochrome c nitrite reductase small subunit [bacterium]|nr:cytochrome c nitrite reductase small subunit [bacterium]